MIGKICLRTLILVSTFLSVLTLQNAGQSSLNSAKIPDDLLIILKKQEGWGGSYSETTITANGDYSVQVRGGLPSPAPLGNLIIKGASRNPPKYLKPKLSTEKLLQLISEFDRIQFFKFGKDFPIEDEKDASFLTDQATEVISIRINGRTKEVSNYLGDSMKRTVVLRNLAEKIRGSGIWNFENNEIPQILKIMYCVTDGDKIEKDFEIRSNGKIIESSYSNIPSPYSEGKTLPAFRKSKTVGKFSKQQLRQLIDEFEKIGFSTFKYSPLAEYDGCSNRPPLVGEKRTHINVEINRVAQMYASLYENCDSKAETKAAKFEHIKSVIEKLLTEAGIGKGR